MSDAETEGRKAAEQVDLTASMRWTLRTHGFGAIFLDSLGKDEELIPDCPYEDDDLADDWKTGFAQALEDRA